MWSPTISSDELYHHGILNMKWGVRNGPPYPLQPGQHSKAEKRAMSKKKSSNTDPGKGATKRKFSLSEDQKKTLKKVAIGAAVVGGTALAAYGAYKVGGPEIKALAKAAINKKTISEHVLNMSTTELLKTGNLSSKGFSKGRLSSDKHKVFKVAPKLHETISREASRRMDFNEALSKNPAKIASRIGPPTPYEAKNIGKTAKYLYENGQSNRGTKVVNTTAFRVTDLEKLLANNRRMQMMANESYKTATKSTESLDYAQELLKKNKGKLSGYTMLDLRDLDLY